MKTAKRRKGWEPVSRWYNKIVGKGGHYYHEHVILPNVRDWISAHYPDGGKLLDLACGQGVLQRSIAKNWDYTGVDIAPSLISAAKKQCKSPKARFIVADATKPLDCPPKHFDLLTVILAMQDIADIEKVFANASKHLKEGGHIALVINHPCFRIPRQTSWGIDEAQKIQYRRIDHYLSPLTIPIRTEPSKGKASPTVNSHHRPLQDYASALASAGFGIVGLEEWCSDKQSTGSKARMENRARSEFPLFLFLVARKLA